MFDGYLRKPVDRAVKPVGQWLRRTRLTPDHLTIAGIVFAIAAAVAIGWGLLPLGLLLVVLAALPDLLDGALAKASNTSSQRGAFFDSVIDRVTDGLFFGGVAWHLIPRGRVAMVPVAVLVVSQVISYMRAKAESLDLEAKGGLMERAERIILLCLGLLWEPALVPIMWVMLVLTAITAVQRFVKVWKQADVAPLTAEKIQARRTARVARRTTRERRREDFIVRHRGRTSGR
jgi:CDP-diacylglycerol---glycerol-3-phosphate 3-phosphatidyltransferase